MIKWTLVALIVASILYVHFRGRVRHKPLRQLSDHSSFMAPINAFMYLFSSVPDRPYHQPETFPELHELTRQWEVIRDEAEQLEHHIKGSSQKDDAGFNSFFRRGWKRFYLKWYGDSHASARELCPKTTEILSNIPSVKAAMFAELPAGSKLMKHRDPYAGSLRYHLGLRTPNDQRCLIDVDGIPYSWRDGEAVMFDETFIHYAKNETEQDRLILFCDIERPMKYRWAGALNRWFSRNVMAAAAAPNDDSDTTGGINRAFKYIYKVREQGKRLKKKNRTLYYIIKWALFIGVIAWILF
ncbi:MULTISPECIES: lipid A hydroxylase LpxO [Larsenimonas]|uniref:Lipid A hydroxylase LpxO n=1 Tax=Larsenimonas suaedae TaxID=1851019 RepID=A0ABU1GTN9_9GAMM|nr:MULTISPECIES: lipid A hydroxylase LpxO [Larsenimonas]MCM2971807.1 lipid A hydroxylase LpxO [Larsenimonas suaedae]MCM5703885.1 lipid A hydroxylase LpxO [Larsenimonas salina]MDR5895359.1 lipid A hydroxylase LpxO [Larsenimonas suaedae]